MIGLSRFPAPLLTLTAILTASVTVSAQEGKTDEEPTEKALRIVPLVTSTPLTGTGVGLSSSYLYRLDDNSSKSQLQVGGQYSNTHSVTLFIRNNAFFRNNSIISNTAILPAKTNSEFNGEDGEDVRYKIETILLTQKLLFRMKDNFYAGGRVFYKNSEYTPNNQAGQDFLFENGIVDQKNGGLGGSLSWDSRQNKYFPRHAYWVDVDADAAPTWLGADDNYGRLTINARYYGAAMRENDVWAHQFFGQYASDKTPDGDLPTLSGKSILRGFPAGQFRARYMTGGQTEYRYLLDDSPFKLIVFAGVAILEGGSYGAGGQERDDDGTYWAGGVGLRYAIQRRTGVDLRLDLVTTSENEESVYLTLNQAF
ncbi:MAG: BamA/TamA family outer membrane protein [Halioglobus sp.]